MCLERPFASPDRLLTVAVGLLFTCLIGCSSIEKAPPQPQSARVDRSFALNVPRIMRGTIASETVLLGYQPVIVRGYGLVVGLNGTGSRDIPPQVRSHMLAEMARHGIGRTSKGLGHIKPTEMLDSPDTAVVIVEAVVPPGAVGRQMQRGLRSSGTRFDTRVYADPRTGTTSLEGGRLYTAELRPVRSGEFLPPTGSQQAAPLAEARGPIFVNPFAEPGALERDTVNRTTGRILNGGEAVKDIPLKMRLSSPGHSRAEIIQSAVNTRFPQEPGQRDPTAWGESDESIRISVPPSYRNDPTEFIELLRHTTILQSRVEAIASNIKRTLVSAPGFAFDASWRWQALGQRALPIVRELYDYAEEMPRLAALRAGAKLGDPLVVPPLIDMASSTSGDVRRQAVVLLGDMQLDPRIDRALRLKLNDDDLDIRLAAYEALALRADPYMSRTVVDGKFILDVVASDEPLIYVAQVGQPRVAIFGRDLALNRPLLLDAWDGRFIMQAERDDKLVEVYYRPADGTERLIETIEPSLEEFIRFLGHKTTIEQPEPGLGLSYGETIGVLYQIWREKYIDADFKAEQDRVLAAIIQQREGRELEQRPEFSDPDFDHLTPSPEGPVAPSDLDELAPPPSVGTTGTGEVGR